MRLIDADALIEQIKNPYTEYPVMIKICKAIEDMINETPTVFQRVESVEIKHGRWVELENAYECSFCGVIRRKGVTGHYAYCPNCGAKMDESTMGQVKPSDRERREDGKADSVER